MNHSVREISLSDIMITDKFWSPRLDLNRRYALLYQWDRYEEIGTIDNFRIAGGLKQGDRRGFFYVDSDLHKWADAASRVLASKKDARLNKLLQEYISAVTSAQEDDGYLYTFNQLHFPGTRWVNLQIEHELYCMGHFIEAGIEHFLATGKKDLFHAAEKTARLICEDFAEPAPARTPGHQEVEVALLRLYEITGEAIYRRTAKNFFKMRGRKRFFGADLIRQFMNHEKRMKEVARQQGDIETKGFDYTETTGDDEPFMINVRLNAAFLSGRYNQQHKPLHRQKKPAGHAVRWVYQQQALAMLCSAGDKEGNLNQQEELWRKLVDGWMYVTGGIGSLPLIEGFGRKYELNNRHAYCETCAAIGSIFWNHELFLLTRNSRYADLLEWQLYNAASVGISSGGDAYFYRNPLDSAGGIQRRPWFDTACCPSNISRLQASLGRYVAAWGDNELWINQFIGSKGDATARGHCFSMKSDLPFGSRVQITVKAAKKRGLTLHLRIPSWADGGKLIVNGHKPRYLGAKKQNLFGADHFETSRYETVTIPAGKKYLLELDFSMPVNILNMHQKVKGAKGRIALTRGPLVYCLEKYRNNGLSHDEGRLLPSKLTYREERDGTGIIIGRDKGGADLIFTPYYDWGNHVPDWMQVWVKQGK